MSKMKVYEFGFLGSKKRVFALSYFMVTVIGILDYFITSDFSFST